MTPNARAFLEAPIERVDVGSAEIALRRFGAGPPLLLIHGWPLSGFTFRHLVPRLAAERTCFVADSPGAGDTRVRDDHDFRFAGQAASYARLVDRLGWDAFDVLAHDTGATIARELALTVGARARKLVLINTEIPGHRPPFIPFYQRVTSLPGAAAVLRLLLRSRAYRRSKMGFGGFFEDKSLLDGEFTDEFVAPLLASRARLDGQLRYLRGIDWALVDGLAARHRELRGEVLFVWGELDETFPAARAAEMVPQLARCAGLRLVPGARLLAHEEKPDEVSAHAIDFLRA
ncbi:MAG TPA: alpha/beta hydrolase [Polyangia bacterium]|nr:alpha/beta hydrolase [Polyangia bacterium]